MRGSAASAYSRVRRAITFPDITIHHPATFFEIIIHPPGMFFARTERQRGGKPSARPGRQAKPPRAGPGPTNAGRGPPRPALASLKRKIYSHNLIIIKCSTHRHRMPYPSNIQLFTKQEDVRNRKTTLGIRTSTSFLFRRDGGPTTEKKGARAPSLGQGEPRCQRPRAAVQFYSADFSFGAGTFRIPTRRYSVFLWCLLYRSGRIQPLCINSRRANRTVGRDILQNLDRL